MNEMKSREKILEELSVGQNRSSECQPPGIPESLIRRVESDWTSEKLIQLFRERLEAAGGEVLPETQYDQLAEFLKSFVDQEGLKKIVVDDEFVPLLVDCNVEVHPASAASQNDMFAADAGIAFAQAAVAEAGVLIVTYGSGRARLTTLTPPLNLIVLPLERLLPDLLDATSLFGDGSGAVWIAGPSKTADIGGVLVRGIHGPSRLIVLPLAAH